MIFYSCVPKPVALRTQYSFQHWDVFSPPQCTNIDVGLSRFKAYSLDFRAISLSKISFSLISNTDARSHSALGNGLEINLAAVATEGSTCDCNVATSHSELSRAFDLIGSRSSITYGSWGTSPPVGWKIKRFSAGCRRKRLPMNRRMMTMSCGGAIKARRASRFTKAATRPSGRWLELRKMSAR